MKQWQNVTECDNNEKSEKETVTNLILFNDKGIVTKKFKWNFFIRLHGRIWLKKVQSNFWIKIFNFDTLRTSSTR